MKESSMRDLDQIKQGEQELVTGAGGFPKSGQAIPPACCAALAPGWCVPASKTGGQAR